jgi:hypothetical protein
METHSVEQGEKNQDERSDAKRREWFEFIRNFIQECRNINLAVSTCCRTQRSNLRVRQYSRSAHCRF